MSRSGDTEAAAPAANLLVAIRDWKIDLLDEKGQLLGWESIKPGILQLVEVVCTPRKRSLQFRSENRLVGAHRTSHVFYDTLCNRFECDDP